MKNLVRCFMFIIYISLFSIDGCYSFVVFNNKFTRSSHVTVSIRKFYRIGDKDYTNAANKAINYLKKQGGGKLIYPTGTYVQGSIEITSSNVTIAGEGKAKTFIIRNNDRGYAFWTNSKNAIKIKNLNVDCDKAMFEGGIYFGGSSDCVVENVSVQNADASTFVVSSILFNRNGLRGNANNNTFRNCSARGQKRYHEVGGKSPFIAGDYASNTRFQNCIVTDCIGDSYDSDNAPGTIFTNCIAVSTKAVSTYTGFWCEGEQTDSDHKVQWIGCRAINFTNGFGISEFAKATIKSCYAKGCTHGVKGINNKYRTIINGFVSDKCGKDLNVDTDGIMSFTGPVTMYNVKTINSLAKNSFCNYAGGHFTSEKTIIGPGCVFDKDLFVSYNSTGSRSILIDGVTFNNSYIVYYNALETELLIKKSKFFNGGINGTRIKRSEITDGCYFVTTQDSIAITLNLDTFNTVVKNSTFKGYRQISNRAVAGTGIKKIH